MENTYFPNTQDEHSYRAFMEIEKAVANARKHESYLTVTQIATAVMAGLKEWGANEDIEFLGSELLNLSHE